MPYVIISKTRPRFIYGVGETENAAWQFAQPVIRDHPQAIYRACSATRALACLVRQHGGTTPWDFLRDGRVGTRGERLGERLDDWERDHV